MTAGRKKLTHTLWRLTRTRKCLTLLPPPYHKGHNRDWIPDFRLFPAVLHIFPLFLLCCTSLFSFGLWEASWGVCCKADEVHTDAVTESKLLLLATRQANKLRDELLGQGIATLFRKPADWEDGGLVSQRTILPNLEFRFASSLSLSFLLNSSRQ